MPYRPLLPIVFLKRSLPLMSILSRTGNLCCFKLFRTHVIVNYIPKEFTWNISVARINLIISKMIRLGLVEPIETDNKYAPNFKITDDGVKAYQAHTFQSLATSSFFNYQTYRMSILMMIVTIISVLVAILSIIVTIYVTNK